MMRNSLASIGLGAVVALACGGCVASPPAEAPSVTQVQVRRTAAREPLLAAIAAIYRDSSVAHDDDWRGTARKVPDVLVMRGIPSPPSSLELRGKTVPVVQSIAEADGTCVTLDVVAVHVLTVEGLLVTAASVTLRRGGLETIAVASPPLARYWLTLDWFNHQRVAIGYWYTSDER